MCGRVACVLNPECVLRQAQIVTESISNCSDATPQHHLSSTHSPQPSQNECSLTTGNCSFNASLFSPSFNITPTCDLPVVIRSPNANSVCEVVCMKWGLDIKAHDGTVYTTHNFRCETGATVCRSLGLTTARCCVLINGYFEWHSKNGKPTQPYFILNESRLPMMVAAYHSLDRRCVSIMTTSSDSSPLNWLHHRIPVLLDSPQKLSSWFDTRQTYQQVSWMFTAVKSPALTWYKISRNEIGNVRNKTASVVIPDELIKKKHGLQNFFPPVKKSKTELNSEKQQRSVDPVIVIDDD